MILFVDEESKVKAVNTTTDSSLRALYVDELNPTFPFKDWSAAKICCYKVTVQNGIVTMFTPYRPSSALDYIDEVGHEADDNADKAQAFDIMIGGAE